MRAIFNSRADPDRAREPITNGAAPASEPATPAERRLFAASLFAIATAFTVAVVWNVHGRTHFIGDDIGSFWFLLRDTFWEFLFRPISVHYVPLHRLTNYTIYRAAPMNYSVALGVLAVLQVASVVLLAKTLGALSDRASNYVVTALYAVNVSVGVLLLWWTSALHRLPYVCMSLAAIYGYVRYRESGRFAYFGLSIVAFFVGLGFYLKAALIPLYLLGVELCLPASPKQPAGWWKRSLPAGALFVVSIAYASWLAASVHEHDQQINLDPYMQVLFQAHSWSVLGASVFGVPFPSMAASLLTGAFWLLVASYTIWRDRSAAVPWLVGVALVSLNILVLGLSNRTLGFGLFIAYMPRYGFEQVFLIALFAGIALQRAQARPFEGRLLSRPVARRAGGALVVASVALVAANSHRNLRDLYHLQFRHFAEVRRYIENLQDDLSRLTKGGKKRLVLRNGRLPPHFGLWPKAIRRQSTLVRLLGADVRFQRRARYKITPNGNIVRIQGVKRRRR